MGTRKIKDARDINTGKLIYFASHAKATYTNDGSTVLEKLDNTVTTSDLNTALENFKDSLEGLGVSGLTVDADKGWLRVTGETSDGDTKNYFIALTELAKPNAPTVAEANRTKYVVTGSASISVVNNTTGSTMYYRTYNASNNTWGAWTTVSSSFSLASGFANDKDNETKTFKVQLKAIKNGEESDINTYDITIKPKVATPSITVSNPNTYGTSASITINLSKTQGATTYYTEDNGNLIKLDSSKTIDYTATENIPMSVTSGKFKAWAKKEKYGDSDTSSSDSINLGNKHTYYGFSTKSTLENTEDIIALAASGGKLAKPSIESSTENSQKIYTIYPKKKDLYSFVGTNVYIWVCIADTLKPDKIYDTWNNIANMGFNEAIVVDDWNCYRLENFIPITDSTPDLTLLLKS